MSDSILRRLLTNAIRRVAVHASGGRLWQFAGYVGEVFTGVEVFHGIGFKSRPAGDGGEAILLKVQANPDLPVAIALRDVDAEKAFEAARGEMAAGETAIFTGSGAYVVIDKNGNVNVVPSATGSVNLGQAALALTQGVVQGEGIDPFTQKTQFVLGNASPFVKARKV
jgi:phage gp45-like